MIYNFVEIKLKQFVISIENQIRNKGGNPVFGIQNKFWTLKVIYPIFFYSKLFKCQISQVLSYIFLFFFVFKTDATMFLKLKFCNIIRNVFTWPHILIMPFFFKA